MKKICFITQCVLPIPTVKGGAVETLVEYILDENEKKPKYQFTVISASDSDAQKKSVKYQYTDFKYVEGTNKHLNAALYDIQRIVQHIGLYTPYSVEFIKLNKIIKKLPEQDLYIYEAGPTTQIPLLGKVIPKNKFLVHIHWDGMGTKAKDKCFLKLLPVSNYIGEQWKNATECDKAKIVPLYNCAKIERFVKKISDAEKRQLKEALNIPSENKVVIYTGRIVPEKGIKELLKAFENVEKDNVTLLIIGSANFGSATNTPYEKEVAQLIEGSTKSIVFTGFIHQTELYQYYNLADVAVMPSMFEDPAPLVCIETQATGTPLIATRVGGISEYADKTGVVLIERNAKLEMNLTKEMERLLDDSDLCAKMGEANRKNALNYNTEEYFNRFSKIIDEILRKNDNNEIIR